MNTKRSGIITILCFAAALILMLIPGFTINEPAWAYANTIVTPTPTIGKPQIPASSEDIPVKTDKQKSPRSQAVLSSPNSTDILNGGFENGSDGSWVEYSSNGWDIILHKDSLPDSLPLLPHGGDWIVWLGGAYEDVSYISQSVTIPSGVSTLKYWYWIGSQDACGFDYAWVKINDTALVSVELCEVNETGGWIERTVDISAYAGATVILQFRVETDASLNSNFFIDDVTLQGVTLGGNYTYLPLIHKNYWRGYSHDFSNPIGGWAIGQNETTIYGYLNGEYQIYLNQDDLGWAITPDLVLPGDYRIEVDARKVSSGVCSYGLIFGAHWTADSWETYQFLVWPTTGEFLVNKRTLDGTWTTIRNWTSSSAINLGNGTNRIRVDRIGTAINLYINGTLVDNLTDSSITGLGRDAGVRAFSYQDSPVDVRFDNFAASQP